MKIPFFNKSSNFQTQIIQSEYQELNKNPYTDFIIAADLLAEYLNIESTIKSVDIYEKTFSKMGFIEKITAMQMYKGDCLVEIKKSNPNNHAFGCYLRINLMQKYADYKVRLSLSSSLVPNSFVERSKGIDAIYEKLLQSSEPYTEFKTLDKDQPLQNLHDSGYEYLHTLLKTSVFISTLNKKNLNYIYPSILAFFSGLIMLEREGVHNFDVLIFSPMVFAITAVICVAMIFYATMIYSFGSRLSVFLHHFVIIFFGLLSTHNTPENLMFLSDKNIWAICLIMISLTQLRYVMRYWLNTVHIANCRNMIAKFLAASDMKI